MCRSLLGGACTDKHPEGSLLFTSPQVLLKEPWENRKSTRSTGSPQEETGMLLNFLIHILTGTRIAELGLVICFSQGLLLRNEMSTNSIKCFFHLSEFLFFFFFHLGGIKASAGHEEEEARDVKDTD